VLSPEFVPVNPSLMYGDARDVGFILWHTAIVSAYHP
jgi:hypothetical protein